MPSRASLSARSFSSSSAWPLTQRHSISCRSAAASRRRQRSSFLTGFLAAVRQPLRLPAVDPARDAAAQILGIGVQAHLARAVQRSSASIAAVSSMRLLVVSASPPLSSFSWPP